MTNVDRYGNKTKRTIKPQWFKAQEIVYSEALELQSSSLALYEPSGRQKRFNTVHVEYSTVLGCGLRRFAHVPSNSFLILLAEENVTVVNGVQLSEYTWGLYQDLSCEKVEIVADVAALNKRQRTKKSAHNGVEDEVDEIYH
ncbi:hypothetical protein K435DRAFT_803080 [Dendrothele bispora CBS 962.96]|uniref:Uncharacterized protein n=1 Tax=Dendrothele bispora (strain CBS 962.96) TaxID=1314807 RepID=A0A4V4HE02_DENBC|nr:hypothetical protein K435DRAFT_803080 [Dendrothele bispora CBS 962.96]